MGVWPDRAAVVPICSRVHSSHVTVPTTYACPAFVEADPYPSTARATSSTWFRTTNVVTATITLLLKGDRMTHWLSWADACVSGYRWEWEGEDPIFKEEIIVAGINCFHSSVDENDCCRDFTCKRQEWVNEFQNVGSLLHWYWFWL